MITKQEVKERKGLCEIGKTIIDFENKKIKIYGKAKDFKRIE